MRSPFAVVATAVALVVVGPSLLSYAGPPKPLPAPVAPTKASSPPGPAKLDSPPKSPTSMAGKVSKKKPTIEQEPVEADLSAVPIRAPLWSKTSNRLSVFGPDVARHGIAVSATNADVSSSRYDKGAFRVAPTAAKTIVTVTTRNNGVVIGTKEFEFLVADPPLPRVDLLVNGKVHDGMSPISRRASLEVRVTPDAHFRATHPKDARYTIDAIDLYVRHGAATPKKKIQTYAGKAKDATRGVATPLGTLLDGEPSGTIVYLKIREVRRLDYAGHGVVQDLSERTRTIDFVLE